jgi:hypothetical protein
VFCTDLLLGSTKNYKPTSQLPRFTYVPWFLRPYSISIFSGLLAAALSVALTLLINNKIFEDGFAPRVSTKVLPFVQISSAAFLWSFLPSLVADQYRLLIKNIDMFYRLVEPYASLRAKIVKPERVRKCFALNYTNDLPVVVTLKALDNGHWKVAFVSLFSLLSSFIPAAASNMFYEDTDVRYGPHIAVWKSYFIFVVIYIGALILFLVAIIPDETRHLPHDLETISDHLSFLSQSSLLDNDRYQYHPARIESSSAEKTKVKFQIRQLISIAKIQAKKTLHSVSGILRETNPWFLSKPVEHVVAELEKSGDDHWVRFGIWDRGDSFTAGVDKHEQEKLLSSYDNEYYRWNIWKRVKEQFL